MTWRATYERRFLGVHLGPDRDALDLDWATFVGDRSEAYEFTVDAAEPRDAYVEIQAFDVGTYGHRLLLNGDPLGGFDLPPSEGWQYWMDSLGDAELVEGTNTLRVTRDTETDDGFAVGTVVVHWKERP